MADYGTRKTDEAVKRAERRLRGVYSEAQRDIWEKLKAWQEAHRAREAKYRKMVADGKMSQDDFDAWMRGQVFQGKQWAARKAEIDKILLNADKAAAKIVNDGKIGVFADNANYIGYGLEHDLRIDSGFTLYDESTVARLIKDDPQILPKAAPGVVKDKAFPYYNKLMSSAITQGIVQGETIAQIAKRIMDKTGESSYKSAVRNARTAYTGAQNAGRIEGLHQAQRLGIEVKKKWLATLDFRTRDTHRDLDGQVRNVDEPFQVDGDEIMFPGDPTAKPALVYNCRCTLIYEYPKYPSSMERLDNITREKIGDMTYRQWEAMKLGKVKKPETVQHATIVNGADISSTWTRNKEDFPFEISDVLHAQGFDGLPSIVPADEFEKAVREANGGAGFVAQRTYSAPDKETLDGYRDMLYHGEWYVNCSVGGAQYGQGMYCAADYTGTLTDGIREEMQHYIDLNKTRGNSFAFTETLTLDKSAKIIKYDELEKKFREYNKHFDYDTMRKNAMNDVFNGMGLNASQAKEYGKMMDGYWTASTKKQIEKYEALKKSLGYSTSDVSALAKDINKRYDELVANKMSDIGSYAASLGYDAINAEGHGQSGSYTVVLNRTKLIFLGG